MSGIEIFVMCIVSFLGGCYAMYYLLKPRMDRLEQQCSKKKAKNDSKLVVMNYVQALEVIDKLNATKNRMRKVEEILTTASLDQKDGSTRCKCVIETANNPELAYTFSSEISVEVARKERAELRTSLIADIDLLCNIRRNVVTQSVTQSRTN